MTCNYLPIETKHIPKPKPIKLARKNIVLLKKNSLKMKQLPQITKILCARKKLFQNEIIERKSFKKIKLYEINAP